jgi:branched-chain amino acid transport system substrate-binding protein
MHRRWSRIFALSMGIPLLLGLLAACGSGTGTDTNASGGPVIIKIGSNFPTTQKDASNGKPTEDGVRYAIDLANKNNFLPGYKLIISAKDDVGSNGTHDPTVGQKNINELIGDAQVAAVVGPLNSSVAKAIMPIANRSGIALISPANTNDCLTQNDPDSECGGSKSLLSSLRPTGNITYFRTATRDVNQGKALAAYAYKVKHYQTAYVIDDTETYGAGLAANFITFFQQFGGKVLDHKSIQSTNSYNNVLTAVAATKPDFLFFGGNDSTGGITIRQQMATTPGLENLPFFAGDGNKTPSFAKAIAPLKPKDVYNTIPGIDPSTVPATKDFNKEEFLNKYKQIGAYTYGAYDDTQIVLQAIKMAIGKNILPPKSPNDTATAKTFRQAVIDAIQHIDYSGLTGHHSFDKNGDTTNTSISIYTTGDPNVGDGWKYLGVVNPDM